MPHPPKLKYPIKRSLGKLAADRTHVINPSLCDEAIQRLAPSLAQHIGCTIIDINPGIGLWSSKLHEFLKPQSHILMEEKQDAYLPFLKPLLDAPGSRYKLKDWFNLDRWRPIRYVEDGLIPSNSESVPPEQLKSPLLIIANLAYQNNRITGRGAMAHIKAIDFAQNVRSRSNFQSYGPTRMLIWCGDEEKHTLLPRTVAQRVKISALLEDTFHVEEILGASSSADVAPREDFLDIESSKQVAKRMEDRSITLPAHRCATRNTSDAPISRHWHQEYRELEEGFESQRLSQFVGQAPGPLVNLRGKPQIRGQEYTPEYMRYRTLKVTFKAQNKNFLKLNELLAKQEEIDNLDIKAHRVGISSEEQAVEFKKVDAKQNSLKSLLEDLSTENFKRYTLLDDNRRAFAQDPPLLLWDRRTSEPLIVKNDEFSPQRAMALLDFQPKFQAEVPLNAEQSTNFEMLTANLLQARGIANLQHLNISAPGAYDALVPKVPTLRDPTKGGRRCIDLLRTRMLTPEMLRHLAIAWDEWLFKPPMKTLLTQFEVNFEFDLEARRGASSRY